MAFKQRLVQHQVQKMIMTAKMQQSMQLLQLPILELSQAIEAELAVNPVLEELTPRQDYETLAPEPSAAADDDFARRLEWMSEANVWDSEETDHDKIRSDQEKRDFQETLLNRSESLPDHLLSQFHLAYPEHPHTAIAEYIIGNIGENGYLMTSVSEIAPALACAESTVEETLALVQLLEPAGVAARDVRECLLLQLARKGKRHAPEALIIEQCLQELAERKYAAIAKQLSLPLPTVKECARRIALLDPKPCRNYAPAALRVVPDVVLEKTTSGFEITINAESMPRLGISGLYRKMLKEKKCPRQTLKFLREHLKNAQYLIDGISQRQHTLKQVCRYIVTIQRESLETGVFHLKPLALKDIAEHLQMHPSTISRTIMNKYMQTPYGTFPIKTFFSQAVAANDASISNQRIKEALDELIKREPADAPYSDQELVARLSQQNMTISRRTVTKYRHALKIPPAHLRKH